MKKKLIILFAMLPVLLHMQSGAQKVEHRVENKSKNTILVTFHANYWREGKPETAFIEYEQPRVTPAGGTQIVKMPTWVLPTMIQVDEYRTQDGNQNVRYAELVQFKLPLNPGPRVLGDDEYYLWSYAADGTISPENGPANSLVRRQ